MNAETARLDPPPSVADSFLKAPDLAEPNERGNGDFHFVVEKRALAVSQELEGGGQLAARVTKEKHTMSDSGVQPPDSVQCEWAKVGTTPDSIQFSQNYRASTETLERRLNLTE